MKTTNDTILTKEILNISITKNMKDIDENDLKSFIMLMNIIEKGIKII